MKKVNLSFGIVVLAVSVFMTSCNKEEVAPSAVSVNDSDEVSAEVIERFKELRFDPNGITKTENGYLVEGDIEVTHEALEKMAEPVIVNGPKGEQYRTYNLVTTFPFGLVRTLKVRTLGTVSTKLSKTLNWALYNYNSLGLKIKFQRVTSGVADIYVRQVAGGAGGYAGFPPGNGNPYSLVTIYSGTNSYSDNVMEHVLGHEIGHCIGMRHSDWFNRSYSCGSGGSEGTGTIGAVFIPGTVVYDPNSQMNACFSSTETGELSVFDKNALNYIY